MRRSTENKLLNFTRIIKRRSGFTLIEVSFAIIILLILILMAYSLYTRYIDKAKMAVAKNVLAQARDNLNLYNIDNGKYPESINFTDCLDGNGRAVFSPAFCDQLREDLYSIKTYDYKTEDKKYILTAEAKDAKHTLLTVTPDDVIR